VMWSKIKNIYKKEKGVKRIIVGLGNPGEKYKETTHNSGFRTLKLIKEKENFPDFKKDNTLNALVSQKDDAILIAPLTFMNRSGTTVSKAAQRFNVSPENITVIHDDTDMEKGVIRFSFSRSSGGHRGVQSIISCLKSKDFNRLRIGVREKEGKAASMVLKKTPRKVKEAEERAAKEVHDTSKRTLHI